MAGNSPIGKMVIELGLDATHMETALTRSMNQLKSFERQIKAQSSLAEFYKKGTEAAKVYARQKDTINKAIITQSNHLEKLNRLYQMEVDENGQFSEKAQRMARNIEISNANLVKLATQLREVTKQSYLAGSSLNTFGDYMENTSKRLKSGATAFDNISKNTKALSLALFGGMTVSAKAAMDFESAFAGVRKTVDGSEAEYARLAAGIRKMATELPASAKEIAGVAEAAGQLGIQNEHILSFTKTMIDMGESTNLSAQEAAVAMAKFQNITQMSQQDFDKLGSTIVHLGNNMATTEKDITEMSLRLASTGKLVGLTEHQIVALAATLSSVGMEAEAGGSAMSRFMQKMNTAVAEGGEALGQFALVAGLSAQEFADKWRSDPSKVIVEFLNGMGKIKAAGGDVTQTLKDLGINSVREIDSLQRLAGAGQLLAKTFDDANVAWQKGTALSREANERYKTSESQLKIFKNKLNDVAITLGGPLLKAFSSILDASKPLINDLANLANRFSELDEGTQRSIVNMALFLGSISPISKAISSTLGGLSAFTGGLGSMAKRMAQIGAEKAAEKAIADLGGQAAATGASVGGLAKAGGALSALVSPTGLLVVGLAAAAAAVYYFSEQSRQAEERTQMWGTTVSKVQSQELAKFKEKVDETNKAILDFAASAGSVDAVRESFKGLVDEISKLTDEKNARLAELGKKWGMSDEEIDKMKASHENIVSNTQSMSDEIIAIYEKHNNDRTRLSDEEQAIVKNNQTEIIKTKLELMKFHGQEVTAITKAMNGELNTLNETQQKEAIKTLEKWLNEEQKTYRTSKKELKELIKNLGKDQVEEREIQTKKLENLEKDHQARMEAYASQWLEIKKRLKPPKLSHELVNDVDFDKLYWDQATEYLKKFGLTLEELEASSTNSFNKMAIGSGLLAKKTRDMSTEAYAAAEAWNALILDPKTGEIKTNAKEVLTEAISTKEGWDQMQFLLKHVDLHSNARLMIGEALQASGKWNTMTLEEKALVVDGKPSIVAILESKRHLDIWNQMPSEVKTILGDNKGFMTNTNEALEALETWNIMTPTQKSLTAANLTKGDVDLAQQTIDGLMGKSVSLNASNDTLSQVLEANRTIDKVRQEKPVDILARNVTQEAVNSSSRLINDVKQFQPAGIYAEDRTQVGVNSAIAAMNSVHDKTVYVTTVHQVIETFQRAARSMFNYEHGTNYHPGGLAMVNDQKGSNYKEMVTLPTGENFIPQGRDVVLPLPKGSKVLTANRTKALMEKLGIPRYAGGVGIPEDAKIFRNIERVENHYLKGHRREVSQQDPTNSQVLTLLKEMVGLMRSGGSQQPLSVTLDIGGVKFSKLVDLISDEMRRQERTRVKTSL